MYHLMPWMTHWGNCNLHAEMVSWHHLSDTERNYKIHNKELLSVVWGLEEWRHILEGTKHIIEILNDHRNLRYFWTSQNLNHWQACWSLLKDTPPHMQTNFAANLLEVHRKAP